jgi:drug/metabolite transporter (DMT)-like permease
VCPPTTAATGKTRRTDPRAAQAATRPVQIPATPRLELSHHAQPAKYRRAPAVVPLVAATACWGAGTVVTRRVLDDVAPLTLLPMQLTASCALLLALCLLTGQRLTWSPGTRRLAALGVLNPGLAYALGLLGLVSITASMSVLLWAAEPVLIVVLAVVLLHEHVPSRLLGALAAAVAEVLLVVHEPGVSGATVGVMLTLAAVGCCALYSVATRRLLLDDSSLPVVLSQQVAASVFAAVLVTIVEFGGVRVGPWVRTAGTPGRRQPPRAASTTGSRSGSTSPACARSTHPWPRRSCR